RLVLRSFSLEGLRLEDGPMPELHDGDCLVRVKAAGLNPSDLMNIKGAFHYTSLPRVPGRDYAGVVDKGPGEWIGPIRLGQRRRTGFFSGWNLCRVRRGPRSFARRKTNEPIVFVSGRSRRS